MMRKMFGAVLVALICRPALANTIDMLGTGGGTHAVPMASMRATRYLCTMHRHFSFSCRSAAMATLFTYQYGYPMNEQTVFQAMYERGNQEKVRREGFSPLDIKRYLASLDFEAGGFEQPLDALKGARLPAIVLLTENGCHHFVMVKDVQGGRVLVGDPAMGTCAIPCASFGGVWGNHLSFVVRNREAGATFNAPSNWRAAPRAPLEEDIDRNGLGDIVVPKYGPSDL